MASSMASDDASLMGWTVLQVWETHGLVDGVG